jgi:hypothetical protein
LKVSNNVIAGSRQFKYLLLSLVVLIVLDGVITNMLVRCGLGREGNPLLQAIAGDGDFLKIKVAGALLCAWLLWDIHRQWRRLALVSSACFVAFYSGVVIWNLSIFFFS